MLASGFKFGWLALCNQSKYSSEIINSMSYSPKYFAMDNFTEGFSPA